MEIPPDLAAGAGDAAIGAMQAIKQAFDAGNGGLRQNYLVQAQRNIAALDPSRHGTLVRHLQARVLALQGRGGDTRMAHVTPGELVIPERLQTPEVLGALRVAAMHAGVDPDRLEVGSGRNAINPETGEPEFADIYYDREGNRIEGITVTAKREPFVPAPSSTLPGHTIGPYRSEMQDSAMRKNPLSIEDRFRMGVMDTNLAVPQTLLHIDPRSWGPEGKTGAAAQMDNMLQKREVEYEARRNASGQSGVDNWRLAGRFVGTLPYTPVANVLAAGRLGRAANTAISGAVGSAMEPVTQKGNFWQQKRDQAATEVLDEAIKSPIRRWVGDQFK